MRYLLAYFLVLVACLVANAPQVNAQTTSVIVLTAPSQVPIGSDGTASFDATAKVTYTGLPYAATSQQTGPFDMLLVGAVYYGTANSPTGSAFSTPDSCLPNPQSGLKPGYANCAIFLACPFVSPPCASETNTVTFHVELQNAALQIYHFQIIAGVVAVSPKAITPIESSTSRADFYVTVTPQESTSSTAATSSVNLTNPTFTSNSPSFPSLEAVGAVGLIILVAAGLLAYRRVRSSRTLPEKAAAAESSPPQVAKGVNKSGNADMFCSQCGARIPCNSKFCKECGTNLT